MAEARNKFVFNPLTGSLDAVRDVVNMVDGPASSTDNAVVRFDGVTGKLIKVSDISIDDSSNLLWATDGVGTIGLDADNRPFEAYAVRQWIAGSINDAGIDPDKFYCYVYAEDTVGSYIGGGRGGDPQNPEFWIAFENTGEIKLYITDDNGVGGDLFQWSFDGEFRLLSASGANILWDTDGSGNIGAEGANRPDNVYAATSVVVGNTVRLLDGSLEQDDNSDADANPAQDLVIKAGNKTAGTGAGGSVVIQPGTSVGGAPGQVVAEGNLLVEGTTVKDSSSVALTADDQIITPSTSYIKITSDTSVFLNRTFTVADGEYEGQELVLHFVQTGDTSCQLLDTGNMKIQGEWQPRNIDSVLSLIWDGNFWMEQSRGFSTALVGSGAQSVSLTADNQLVTPTNPHVVLISNSAVPADRTFTLPNGTNGQILTLVMYNNGSGDRAQLNSSGNVKLAGGVAWEPNGDDNIRLIWSVYAWLELSRATV